MQLTALAALLFAGLAVAPPPPRYFLRLFDDDHCSEPMGTMRIRHVREGLCLAVGNDIDSLRYTSTKRGPKNNCKLIAYDGNDDCNGPGTTFEPRGTQGTLAGICLADYESFRYVCD